MLCTIPLKITVVDNQPVGDGLVTNETQPLMQTGLIHMEEFTLFITSSLAKLCNFQERQRTHTLVTILSTALPQVSPSSTLSHHYDRKPRHHTNNGLAEGISGSAGSLYGSNTSLPKNCIYPLSAPETWAMEDYIKEALSFSFICPFTSLSASGFFFVERKDGRLQPCIDYWGLNAITVKHPYPLPGTTSSVTTGVQFDPDTRERWKTASITSQGHYEYLVMPYVLTNAPAVFQSFIANIFRDILNQCIIIYKDNILIYSKTYTAPVSHVHNVSQ